MKRWRSILTLTALATLPMGAWQFAGAQPVEKTVQDIRALYSLIEQNVSRGEYRVQQKRFPYCAGVTDQNRTLWKDSTGISRKYVESGGSDDSAITSSYYLSSKGHIQFVLIEVGRVNGNSESLRVYFDSYGRIIRTLVNPQTSGTELWRFLKLDVNRAFNAPDGCLTR
ncbi:hypothetical protein [Deinococcus sp. 6GRE01]|uniref:hypothetical protein n=1 Tax=Deinococcus sp. 6GRE01 TaxID=2745873 RepID=UPI001E5B5CF0|nr:hypothetical protein [Deinococcus sp. 6GRE01]MCD0156562.1 hypothetical protein [Deinococcus sp. 6GRE01]